MVALEYGLHALKAIPKAEGGRGKKGGLWEYARRIGKTESYIRQPRDAAEVVKTSHLDAKFLDKARHLAAVQALPESKRAFQNLALHEQHRNGKIIHDKGFSHRRR